MRWGIQLEHIWTRYILSTVENLAAMWCYRIEIGNSFLHWDKPQFPWNDFEERWHPIQRFLALVVLQRALWWCCLMTLGVCWWCRWMQSLIISLVWKPRMCRASFSSICLCWFAVFLRTYRILHTTDHIAFILQIAFLHIAGHKAFALMSS